jgi:hypothetical protein
MEALNKRISVIHILVITFLFTCWFFVSAFSCTEAVTIPTDEPSATTNEISSLDDKIQPPPRNSIELSPTSTGEEVFYSRCATCHNPEQKIDKYHGEQWEMIIGRMIEKDGAMFTPELAEKVYQYLYDRTKHPDDPPFEEVIKGRSHFENIGDGSSDSDTQTQDGAK